MESRNGDSLIRLLDDPDEQVFEAVSQKIRQVGPALLPDLEHAAVRSMDPVIHNRLEILIRELQLVQLHADLARWVVSPEQSLLEGAWLLTRFQFPYLTIEMFRQQIKPLRDEIWLELADNLTAIEKIRLMDTFLFGRNRVFLNSQHPESPGNNFINRVLETGKANEHSMALIFALLAQELALPVFVVDMPDYPILAFVDMMYLVEKDQNPSMFDVLFYINPVENGSLHSRNDITNFLLQQSLPLDPKYYEPMPNDQLVRICLERLSEDYENSGSKIRQMQVQELLKVWK